MLFLVLLMKTMPDMLPNAPPRRVTCRLPKDAPCGALLAAGAGSADALGLASAGPAAALSAELVSGLVEVAALLTCLLQAPTACKSAGAGASNADGHIAACRVKPASCTEQADRLEQAGAITCAHAATDQRARTCYECAERRKGHRSSRTTDAASE